MDERWKNYNILPHILIYRFERDFIDRHMEVPLSLRRKKRRMEKILWGQWMI
jgi:hypothetical protein